MTKTSELIKRLDSCPLGKAGWKQFENTCLDILCYLFVPPLTKPKIQTRTYSGISIRDATFPNRNFGSNNSWGNILLELDARLILFEFKNYNITEIGKEEVDQINSYITGPMGRLAIMCCSKKPNKSAHIQRNTIFSNEQKVILFLTKDELKEMLYIKERGENPADLIVDMIEWFYLQHE
jgi:hypothetical protein